MERKVIMGVSRASAGLALLMGTQVAMADIALQAQEVAVGSFRVLPTLTEQTVYDDNIYSLPSNAVSSFIQILSPSVRIAAQDRNNVYSVNYAMKGAGYANDSNDSYNDHNLAANAHIEPSARLKLDGGLAFSMLHDDRGTAASAGIGLPNILKMGEVDKYDVTMVSGGMLYGADTAQGHLVANVSRSNKRYSRDLVAKLRDNDQTQLFLEFNARVQPKTQVLLDYERVDTNYTGATADTVDNRYLLGVTWADSVQSTGRLRVGTGKRDVKGGRSISKSTWDLGMVWSPLRYDSFNINAMQRTSDATLPYSTVDSSSYSVSWNHNWLARLDSSLTATLGKDDYSLEPGYTAVARNDDTKNITAQLNYQMRRWLVLNATISAVDRNSSVASFDYRRNSFSIGAQIGL